MRYIKRFPIIDTVLFEYDDICIQANIVEIPINLIEEIINDSDNFSQETMPILYFRRKTTEPKPNTRVYTNNPNHFNDYTTKGFKIVYKIDKIVEQIYKRGWIIGADNLTMNDFFNIFKKLVII